MTTVKFANGEVHSCPHLATIPNQQMAFVALDDVSFAEASAIFADESKTSVMEYGEYRLVGYTNLLYVMHENYGFKACLTGGHDERIN